MNHIYAYTLQTWREILHGSPTLQISKAVFGWLQIAATLPQTLIHPNSFPFFLTLGFEILRSSPFKPGQVGKDRKTGANAPKKGRKSPLRADPLWCQPR